jgi:hypothetical protein
LYEAEEPRLVPLQTEPEYHRYEYPPEPPEGVAVRVWDWPLSMAGEIGLIETEGGGLTLTVLVAEAELPRESETTTQYTSVAGGVVKIGVVNDEALLSEAPAQDEPEYQL